MSISCRFAVPFFLLCSALASSASWAHSAAPTTEIVTIGFAAPLAEVSARQSRNAALLAVEEINKGNPTINGRAIVFELLEQDDKADPRISEFIARSFANSKAIGVIGHWNSATTVAAAPIYHTAANFTILVEPQLHAEILQDGVPGHRQRRRRTRAGGRLPGRRTETETRAGARRRRIPRHQHGGLFLQSCEGRRW